MRKQFFSKRAGKNIGMNILNFAFASMMALLLCACVNLNEKRMADLANNTGQDDDQKVVCRKIPVSGSRIGRKVCATKNQWASWNEKKRQNAEGYIRDASEAGRHDTTYPIPIESPPEGMEAFVPQ